MPLSLFTLPRPIAGWRSAARRRWYAVDKDTLIFGCIIGGIVAAFGLLLHAMLTRQNDGPSLTCLALNVYFEARGESEAGQYAVAEVTMNRVASGRYADTVCGVVHQKNWDPIRRRYVGAFSWTELDTKPVPKGAEWQRARDVAKAVYYGQRAPVLGGALHYHATYIEPSWSKGATPVARIGKHVFYRLDE
jgi:N-acetylmuramoyl-L-alanine amidase